jgi:crotonobetainyl-CoA:carnitine CoA-transferase CaiB-like acyl-CoA transferase
MEKPMGLLRGWHDQDGQILHVLTAEPQSIEDVLSSLETPAERPAYAEIVEALWGHQIAASGGSQVGPIFLGWPMAAYGAAWLSEIGIGAALFARERGSGGQAVTTSLVDGLAILGAQQWVFGDGIVPNPPVGGPTGPTLHRVVAAPFECADGIWVHLNTYLRGGFNRLMKAIGGEDYVLEGLVNVGHGDEVTPQQAIDLWNFLITTFKTEPAQHWVDLLSRVDVPCMPTLPPGAAFFTEQVEVNRLVTIECEGTRSLGIFAKYSGTPVLPGRGVPQPGADQRLLSNPGRSGPLAPRRLGPHDRRGHQPGPLGGVTVVDLGVFMAGPFGPRLLADLGARVVKVEEPGGDPMRGRLSSQMSGWLVSSRGKESIGINLKCAPGRQVAHELIKKADVVHHNLRQGALESLGISYDQCSKINPGLIYCHSSGYGNDGPWGGLPTLELLHSAFTGLLLRAAGEGNPPAGYLTHMDYGAGLTSALATIAALFARERSGLGQYVEVPQTAAGLVALSDVYVEGDATHDGFALDSERRGPAPTNALFRTRDGWVTVACYSEGEWSRLKKALDLPDRLPGYADARQLRLGHPGTEILDQAFLRLTNSDVRRRLNAADVPYAAPRQLDVHQAVNDPTLRALGVVLEAVQGDFGPVVEVGHTLRFSADPIQHRRTAPTFGQQTRAILSEIGCTDSQIRRLLGAQVVEGPTNDDPGNVQDMRIRAAREGKP